MKNEMSKGIKKVMLPLLAAAIAGGGGGMLPILNFVWAFDPD
jgi:hypothetical protein